MPDHSGFSALMRALGFLTRLPIDSRHFNDVDHFDTADDASVFPLAGAVLAMPAALLILIAGWFDAPIMLTSAAAIMITIAITGALHEDGLADVADGFGGGSNTEKRLAIMKDSAVGAYGGLALIGSVLIRTLALAAIMTAGGPLGAAVVFIIVHMAARAAMVWHWTQLASARPDGVSARAGQPLDGQLNAALLWGVLAFILIGFVAAGPVATASASLLTLGAMIAFRRLCNRAIGGQTGDTIGAAEQIAEATLLVGLAMAV